MKIHLCPPYAKLEGINHINLTPEMNPKNGHAKDATAG